MLGKKGERKEWDMKVLSKTACFQSKHTHTHIYIFTLIKMQDNKQNVEQIKLNMGIKTVQMMIQRAFLIYPSTVFEIILYIYVHIIEWKRTRRCLIP